MTDELTAICGYCHLSRSSCDHADLWRLALDWEDACLQIKINPDLAVQATVLAQRTQIDALERKLQGQLDATERATETAGRWLASYQRAAEEATVLRADLTGVEQTLARQHERIAALEAALRDLASSPAQFDDERVRYLTMQIDREDLSNARGLLGARAGRKDEMSITDADRGNAIGFLDYLQEHGPDGNLYEEAERCGLLREEPHAQPCEIEGCACEESWDFLVRPGPTLLALRTLLAPPPAQRGENA